MMNFPRKLGLLLIGVAVAASWSHHAGWALPSLRWFFSFGATPDQVLEAGDWSFLGIPVDGRWLRENQAELVGDTMCGLLALAGLVLILGGGRFHWNPLTLRKAERFRSIGRGYGSLKVLLALMALALCDQALVGKRALAVRHEGRWVFPAFEQKIYEEREFGGEGREEANYRALKERLADGDSLVILPPVPWDPTFDSDEVMKRHLLMNNGLIFDSRGKGPYTGYAICGQKSRPEQVVRSGSVRSGKLHGPVQVQGGDGELLGREDWNHGVLESSTVPEAAVVPEAGQWVERIYPPIPPSWGKRHFLGTDSRGWDVLSQLFGGFQVLMKAASLYLLLSYGVGITLGSLMGYFGGWFDLAMQRVMEIMSNVPFLLVVMIIVANLGKDRVSLVTIMLIFCLFSWISAATYLRTATYKEKARDYASAARVLGAGTARVIFRHILPNAIAIIVTLVPFGVASVITALTALDYLGFGLPERYPSWGRLLEDGVSNLGSPWIVSSVFGMMVFVLLLITFIGEAIREAFDPRKYTTFQ